MRRRHSNIGLLTLLTVLWAMALQTVCQAESPYFQIQVVDDITGRGVPLVELETTNHIVHFTDSAGNVAFFEPGLMNQTVFFHVRSHGYEFPMDGFKYRGTQVEVKPGGKTTLKVKRINLAERLYRITGSGVYRDTMLLGQQPPVAEPLLNAKVVGSDSVVNAILKGRLHWFWGDTLRPSYPLGNFDVPGAVSDLPNRGGLDPATGINLDYFKDTNGFAKATAKMPGQGPTWIFGAGVVKSPEGNEELMTGYMKVEPPLKVYARGVAKFHAEKQEFENVVQFPHIPVLFPEGQTLTFRDHDVDYLYFCTPYPLVRVPATTTAFCDPTQYEAYTCLREGTTQDNAEIDRDAQGRIRYSWKRNTAIVNPTIQKRLLETGLLKPDETLLRLKDRDTGKSVICHTGTINWNAFRKRWVMVAVQHYGTSLLGELWYAEADNLLGPWNYAVKILTHKDYSFYNPRQHPYFDQQDGRLIYFEGTYTQMFSGNPTATPRYEYNQMMYRLDVGDPRTALPIPFYQSNATELFQSSKDSKLNSDDVFFVMAKTKFLAFDRPTSDTIPVYVSPKSETTGWKLTTEKSELATLTDALFYALPHDTQSPPASVTPLYEYVEMNGGQRQYHLGNKGSLPGFQRSKTPLCLVWKP